jgi:hypothetical protein
MLDKNDRTNFEGRDDASALQPRFGGPPMAWFQSLDEVPGVDWRVPVDVIANPLFVGARVIPDPRDSPLGVWVDRAGRPMRDGYESYLSPAELVLADRRGMRNPEKAFQTMCTALAVPGRPSDYHTALRWFADLAGAPGDWVELALQVDVQLVLADPEGALLSPWSVLAGTKFDKVWHQASKPILRLIGLYLSEGFLIEAAQAEMLLDRLPEAAQPGSGHWRRRAEIASTLSELMA